MDNNSYFFRDDTRAVAPLIGFILLFGFLILGLSLYQVAVVPNDNRETEFLHNQQVQNDFLDLRDVTHNSGLDQISRSLSISLGTQYTSRIITINPPPPAGTVSTVDPGSAITVQNSNTEWDFSTQYIQYEPQYREYQDPPITSIEHTLVYNRFESASTNQTRSGQRILEPDRLVIPIVEGDVSTTRSDSISLRVTHRERETIEMSDNVTVTLPTQVPELWEQELTSDGVDNLSITTTATTVEIEADVSEIVLYRIELGEGSPETPTDTISEEIS